LRIDEIMTTGTVWDPDDHGGGMYPADFVPFRFVAGAA